MRLEIWARRLGLAGFVLLAAFLLLKLARAADTMEAYRAAQAAQPAATPAWRLQARFDQAQAPLALLGDGWSVHEAGSGVWSQAKVATLRIPASGGSGGARITLTVDPFIAGAGGQRVRVLAAGQVLAERTLDKAGATEIAVTAPAGPTDATGRVELRLELPDAVRPPDSADPRLLGVKLIAVSAAG